MNIKENLLPDFATRTSSVDMLVFHCNAYDLETFCGYMKQYKTSAHYYIDEKGEITRLVAKENKAYHAGIGYWRGNTNINDRSIGIELQSKSLGQTPYPEAQIKSLIELSQTLIEKYKIIGQNIIGHADITPNKKPDPGLWFPWKYLAQNQIGLYPQSLSTPKETNIKKLLSEIGYNTENDDMVKASAYAFCRRYVPKFVKIDPDVMHLVDNVLPDSYDFMSDYGFLCVLNSVNETYKKSA